MQPGSRQCWLIGSSVPLLGFWPFLVLLLLLLFSHIGRLLLPLALGFPL